MMTRLVPKVFFNHLHEGLDLFVHGLGFKVHYQDGELAVVGRDGAKAYIVQSSEYAAKDRPEITIETDDIASIYQEVASSRPDLLHPNASTISSKPWGSQEFAVRDRTDVCVIFRQW